MAHLCKRKQQGHRVLFCQPSPVTLVHKLQRKKKKKISYLFLKKNFNSALAKLLLVSVIIIGNKAAPPKHDFQSQSRLSVQKYIQHNFFKFSSSCIYPAFLACFFFLCFLFGSCHCLFILQSSFFCHSGDDSHL